ETVWRALTDATILADWLFPNDFVPRVGHRFTFEVPPKPEEGFDGMTVPSEVLECTPPKRLVLSWETGPPVGDRVSFDVEPDGAGTLVRFEHAGFQPAMPWGKQAYGGAAHGWDGMFERLADVVDGLTGA